MGTQAHCWVSEVESLRVVGWMEAVAVVQEKGGKSQSDCA